MVHFWNDDRIKAISFQWRRPTPQKWYISSSNPDPFAKYRLAHFSLRYILLSHFCCHTHIDLTNTLDDKTHLVQPLFLQATEVTKIKTTDKEYAVLTENQPWVTDNQH